MTRKDFQFIADVIAEYPSHSPSLRDARESFAYSFADALRTTNPRFDRKRFLTAALPTTPHAMGYADQEKGGLLG